MNLLLVVMEHRLSEEFYLMKKFLPLLGGIGKKGLEIR